jgi:hypothetical protein
LMRTTEMIRVQTSGEFPSTASATWRAETRRWPCGAQSARSLHSPKRRNGGGGAPRAQRKQNLPAF